VKIKELKITGQSASKDFSREGEHAKLFFLFCLCLFSIFWLMDRFRLEGIKKNSAVKGQKWGDTTSSHSRSRRLKGLAAGTRLFRRGIPIDGNVAGPKLKIGSTGSASVRRDFRCRRGARFSAADLLKTRGQKEGRARSGRGKPMLYGLQQELSVQVRLGRRAGHPREEGKKT